MLSEEKSLVGMHSFFHRSIFLIARMVKATDLCLARGPIRVHTRSTSRGGWSPLSPPTRSTPARKTTYHAIAPVPNCTMTSQNTNGTTYQNTADMQESHNTTENNSDCISAYKSVYACFMHMLHTTWCSMHMGHLCYDYINE